MCTADSGRLGAMTKSKNEPNNTIALINKEKSLVISAFTNAKFVRSGNKVLGHDAYMRRLRMLSRDPRKHCCARYSLAISPRVIGEHVVENSV